MFNRVLVPLDGSAIAQSAVPAAQNLVARSGGAMRLLSVHDVGWAMATGERFDSARHRAETYLAGVKTTVELKGTPVTAVLREGYVVHQILGEAEAWGADLIALATHGRGGLSRFWLGSVADQCIRRAHRPVLLLRPPEQDQEEDPPPFQMTRIVVPVDQSDLSELPRVHGHV